MILKIINVFPDKVRVNKFDVFGTVISVEFVLLGFLHSIKHAC